MAPGYLQRLFLQSAQMRHTSQLSLPFDRNCKSLILLPIKTVVSTQTRTRPLHLSCRFRDANFNHQKEKPDATKPSGHSSLNSAFQGKSFSVLKYIKKTIPLSVKLDVPVGFFSTSSMKEMGKNLGNFSSSNTPLFEFFSLRELLSTPPSFMIYGLGGLVPFSSIPIYMYMTSSFCPSLAYVQLVYGACILSFLGGVSWGHELLKPRDSTFRSLGYSIFLPLISWTGVLIYPHFAAFPIVLSGVAFAGFVDTQYQAYPLWFKNLRFLLTSLVIFSLISTFIFSFTKTNNDKHVTDQTTD